MLLLTCLLYFLINISIAENDLDPLPIRCVKGVRRFSSKISSSHFYECLLSLIITCCKILIFRFWRQWKSNFEEMPRWPDICNPQAGNRLFRHKHYLVFWFQRCLPKSEAGLGPLNDKALGRNLQLGSFFDGRLKIW